MKNGLVIVGMVFGIAGVGRCDMLLNAGDTFTYEFQTVPFEYSVLPPQFLTVNAHFGYGLDPATFDSTTDMIRVEAFETSTNEPPFFSGSSPNAVGYAWIVQSSPTHWQDLQGVLRITVVTGSVVLRSIQVGVVITRAGGGYSAYNTPTIPVPLPSLRIVPTVDGAMLTWPSQFTNWTLEASTTLGSSNSWTAITNTPVPVGTELTVTDTAAEQARFYRLRSP